MAIQMAETEAVSLMDLHMHSTISDGSDTPDVIVRRVRETGIRLFSVTDHDAVQGCQIIRRGLKESDPCFIAGVEFSCRDEEGKYHILGYGYDADAEAIQAVVEHGHALRMKKVTARLKFLEERFGFVFPEDEIARLLAMPNPGKPHIGNLMAKYGFARSKDEAITQYINQLRFREEYVGPEEAIRGILSAGGIPVLAHPFYGDGDQLILGEDMDRRIRRLMAFGLQGLEAFYSGFSGKLRQQALSFAETYGLYVTAGSDYHGTNKLIELGDTGLPADQPYPDGLRRFLEDVSVWQGNHGK